MNDDDFIATGKTHMLWVGINRYESPRWPTLKNAVSGSEALEEVLEANFGLEDEDVVRLVNQAATLADIEMAVRAYGPGGPKEIEEEDHLIISFAGHGDLDQLTDEAAFIPYDGQPESPSTWFRFDHLRPLLNAVSARHILVVSDSCFSGGVFRSSVKAQNKKPKLEYARRAFLKSSRQMISSGGMEQTTDSGGKIGCSVFISGLTHSLNSSGGDWILASEIFLSTRDYVVEHSDQTPEFGAISRSGHMGGEMVLFGRKAKGSSKAKRSIRNSNIRSSQRRPGPLGSKEARSIDYEDNTIEGLLFNFFRRVQLLVEEKSEGDWMGFTETMKLFDREQDFFTSFLSGGALPKGSSSESVEKAVKYLERCARGLSYGFCHYDHDYRCNRIFYHDLKKFLNEETVKFRGIVADQKREKW